MNNQLKTFQFDGIPVSVIDQHGEGWMIGEDIGTALNYNDPRDSISKIFERNRDELEEYSVTVKLTATDGKQYDTRVYNEEGVMMIGFFSKQPKAASFRKWAVKVLKAYRHKEPAVQPTIPLRDHAQLQSRYEAMQTKYITLLEQQNEQLKIVVTSPPRTRRLWTAEEKAQMYAKKAAGKSLGQIAREMERPDGSVRCFFHHEKLKGGAL